MEAQKQNLIQISIYQKSKPAIKMITEAGLIGKIGLNAAGVGVCFNAIKAKGLNISGIPAHVALRMVLESTSVRGALHDLQELGMAASAHILIGDATGDAVGYEFTSSTSADLCVNEQGQLIHTNHLLEACEGVQAPLWLDDSTERLARMGTLTKALVGEQLDWNKFSRLFEDEGGYPTSICRAQEGISKSATLFNIVMDLKARKAVVKLGRPCQADEVFELTFQEG